jgi:hypothetical protein
METTLISASGRLNLTKLAISITGNGKAGTYIPVFFEIGSINKIIAVSFKDAQLKVAQHQAIEGSRAGSVDGAFV